MKYFPVILIVLILLITPCLAEETTITLSFTGDCTLGSEEYLHKRDGSFDDYIRKYGVTYPFEKVRDIFSKDDMTIINLEGVLSDSSKGENKKKTYRFRGPASFVDILTSSSVELANLSNNHSGDYGKAGLQSTKDILKAAGVAYCHNQDVHIATVNGIRIAFVGLSMHEHYAIGKEINEIIASLKANGECDFVVLNFHFGWEYSFVHNRKQFLTAHEAIGSGADLIIGTHPHVVQGIEQYKNRLILYSLGNFSFGGNTKLKPKSLQAYIAQVKLTFRDGVFYSQQLNIIPVHTTSAAPLNNFQPYLVTGEEAQAVVERIQGDTPFQLNPYEEGVGALQDPILAN